LVSFFTLKIYVVGVVVLELAATNNLLQTDNLGGVCIVVSPLLKFTTTQSPHEFELRVALGEVEISIHRPSQKIVVRIWVF